MPTGRGLRTVALCALLGSSGCSREPTVDWSAPENFVLYEASEDRPEGRVLTYWSLVNVPALALYDALSEVESYAGFVPGVDQVSIVALGSHSKTVQISQRVIGRQSNAKVEWTFHPEDKRIEFRTLESNLSYNDGSYEVLSSPDARRALVKTRYVIRTDKSAKEVPLGVLVSGTREAFLSAAAGVKRRATTPQATAGTPALGAAELVRPMVHGATAGVAALP